VNAIRLLTLIGALVFAAIGMSAPLITIFLEELGSDYRGISLILASAGLVALLANYAWGRVSDRIGRRKPLIVAGLLGAACAYIVLSLVSAPAAAWAARLGEAAAMAAYGTASLALMGDLLGGGDQADRRGVRIGAYRGIASLAFAGGAVVGGPLADAYSLRVMLAACGGLYALAGVAALGLREAAPVAVAQEPVAETPSGRPKGARAPLPFAFLAGVFLWMAAHVGASSMWPNFMATLGYSKSAISGLWGLAAFTEAPSMLVVGRLSDAIGRAPLLVAGALGMVGVDLGYILLSRVLAPLLGVQLLGGFSYASHTATAMTSPNAGNRQTAVAARERSTPPAARGTWQDSC
jgi:MFS family permease